MKSSSSIPHRTLTRFAVLSLALLFALPVRMFAPPLPPGPTVTLVTPGGINDEQTSYPFSSAMVNDLTTNVVKVYVDFTPAADGSLSGGGVLQNGTNVLTVANALAAQSALQALLFTPVANLIPVPTSANVTFHVRVTDANNNSSSGNTTLNITATNNAPALTATAPFNYSITDKTNTPVFTGVTITDVDNSGTQAVTVTITLDNTTKGTFSTLAGFANSGGTYTLTDTPANVTTALSQLVFQPTPNRVTPGTSETTTFTLSVDDGYATPVTSSAYSVTALSINDAPTITAGLPLSYNIGDNMTAPVFTNTTIADVDLSGTQTVYVTLVINETNNPGTMNIPTNVVPGFTNNSTGYAFTGTVSGTPAQVTAALRALKYVPTPHHVPVGSNETATFTLVVDDHSGGAATNSSYSVTATAINDLPQIFGVTTNHIQVQTPNSTSPFSAITLIDANQNVNLSDHNGENLNWSVSLSGPAPLGYLAFNGNNIGTNYSSSGDPTVASSNLRLLTYHAPSVSLTTTNVLTLTITADDGHPGGLVSTNKAIDLYTIYSPPGLSGTQSGQITYDNATIALFSKVSIQSFNGNAMSVWISLAGGATNDIQGQLINLGSFTKSSVSNAPSLYQYTGTSEGATAAIRALLFQPTPNRIIGSSLGEIATFAITLVDGNFTNTPPDTTTTVSVTPFNYPPTLAGISPLVTIQDTDTLAPFSQVLITDPNENGNQAVTATITLDSTTKGGFSAASLLASTFTNVNGSYTFTGRPAALTAAIHQLVFIPTQGLVAVGLNTITTFNLNLNDTYGGIVNNSATQVRVVSVSGGPFLHLPAEPASTRLSTNNYVLAAITVSDSTALKLNVRINDPTQGSFTTNSLMTSGFTNLGGGLYYISGVATNINKALGQLDFLPGATLANGATVHFTISVTNALLNYASADHAIVLRKVQNSFIVTRLTDYDPSSTNAPVPGSLRLAIATANSGDHITFDIRSTTNGIPAYPAVIHLVAPITLNNNLTFDGPGADSLTISGDGNGTNDAQHVQLFTVNAAVTMNRLAFSKGHTSNAGGAFEVTAAGDLVLSYCSVTASTAAFWGGAVDVDQGSLIVDHCLIAGNSTSSAQGLGGGGISLWTYWPCLIENTTFATNRQNAVGGLGGGALYAATADPGIEFDASVVNCTFHDNRDVSGQGTSIRPDVDNNTVVHLQNSIVADGQGRNIEMDQGGLVISFGGNISDDGTASMYSAGGQPLNTIIFNQPGDQVNVNATNLFSALSNNGGPTGTYPLVPGSRAIGNAIANSVSAAYTNTLGTDQRGYFRDGSPDSGAYERGAGQRLIIEELRFNPGPTNTGDQFIEFYVPHDSTNLDVAGYQLLVDGVLRHTFSAQPLQPGNALVLFSAGTVNTSLPAGVKTQTSANPLMMDPSAGQLTLLNASNQIVFQADYVGAFAVTDTNNDYGYLANNYQSLVLSPQFQGVFLPYQRAVAKVGGSNPNGLLANPGYDTIGQPLAPGNAPPSAYADTASTDAHTILTNLNVLANDVDLDINDVLRVVGVGTNGNPGVTGFTNLSVLGAGLFINNSPTNGLSVSYNPKVSPFLTSLPQGSNVVDSFQYTIQDYITAPEYAAYTNQIYTYTNQGPTVTNLVMVSTNPAIVSVNVFLTSSNLASLSSSPVIVSTNTINITSNLVFSTTNVFLASSNLVVISTNSVIINTPWIYLDASNHYRGTNVSDTSSPTYMGNLTKATATVTVHVVGVNAAPTPQNDSTNTASLLTTAANAVLDFTTATNILENDTDPNSDDNSTTLQIISLSPTNGFIPYTLAITSALGATVTLDIRFDRTQTHITYDPRGSTNLLALGYGQTISDTFYYTIQDSHGAIGTAAISILVQGINNAPTANPDSFTTDQNTPRTLPFAAFLANDTDPDTEDQSQLTITGVANSTLGASVVISGTNVIYDPTVSLTLKALGRKEFATDTFLYTISDPWGLTSTATNTVTVAGRNDHPVGQPDAYTTGEKIPFTTNAPGVLVNDTDPDIHDTIRVLPATNTTPFGVTVAVNADGSFTYDPRTHFDWLYQGQLTNDSFNYVVMDHSLSIANDDVFTVTASTSNNILPVLANDAVLSQAGGVFTIMGLSTPNQGGTLSINTNSLAVVYTPLPGFTGTETFRYTNSDGLGGGDWANVTVTVAGSALYANADAFTVAKGTTNVLNLLANDTILPATGAAMTITSLGTPNSGGMVTLNGTGPNNQVNYSPNPVATNLQVESFTYTVTSGSLTATGVVYVTVFDRNNVLSLAAQNDFFTVMANGASSTLDVLANDGNLSAPNPNLVLTSITPPAHGTASLNTAHTRIVYKPSSLVTGTNGYSDVINYYFTDNAGGTGTATLNVYVVPSGFYANNDYFLVEKNSATNNLPVMINDVILPNFGQTLTISDVGIGTNAPNHGGTVTINGAGTGLVYTPAATNYTGGEDFGYEISDGSPARALGHVHVQLVNSGALAGNPDTYRVQPNSTSNPLPVLNNDSSLPLLPGTLTITGLETNGVHGTVAYNNPSNSTSLFYTPNPGFIGQDLFGYETMDNLGNKGTNLVTITVGALYPQNDAFSVLSNSTNTLDVLANDLVYPDPNSDRNIYQVYGTDQGGSVTTNSTGTAVIYKPAAGFTGVEHFTYQLQDDSTLLYTAQATVTVVQQGSDRDTRTVTMTLVGTNDLPTITGSTNSAITDKQTVNVFTNLTVWDVDQFDQQLQIATIEMDQLYNETLQNLGGFVQTAPGHFTMTDTPPNITAALNGIVFAPLENHIMVPTPVTTHLLLSLYDQYIPNTFNAVPVTNLTTVTITPVDDAPTIVGAVTNAIDDKSTVLPFPNIVVADVDNSTTQALIAHIILDHVDNQSLTNLGGFSNLGGGVYVYGTTNGTVTGAMITAALQGIVLVPTPNHIIVPTTVTTLLTLTVDDTFLPTVTNAQTTVSITASNDIPTISGTVTNAITDQQTVNPFATTVIADVDNDGLQTQTVYITLDHLDNQSLTNLGGFTLVTNGVFGMMDTPTNITTALQGIVLVPTPNHITVPTSVTTHLALSDDDGFAATVFDTNTTVTITSVNDAPTITGNGNYAITDKQTVQPFASINVGDVDNDGQQILTVDLVMDNLDKGALQNLGGFTLITNGLFELSDTPAHITTSLRGMLYVPVPNHIPVPTTVTTHLTLNANDGFAPVVTNLTTVSVTASNDTPIISGTVAGQIIYDRSSIKPFFTTLITEVDDDTTQALRMTITLDTTTKGYFTQLGGFTNLGNGVYSYGVARGNVTAAMITTALRGLIYTPTTVNRVTPGAPETTRFTLRLDDFYCPTVVDSNTTVIAFDALTAKVMAGDRSSAAQFGWSVANTRDLAVIGAPHDSVLSANAGSVYLFARSLDGSNTWTQIKKLVAPDSHANDAFGTSVGISGNTVVVGAPFNTSATNQGAAYVYESNLGGVNQWGFERKLVSTNVVLNDQLGTSVAISGDDIVVGVPLSDTTGIGGDTGSAYIYERNIGGAGQWGVLKRLVSTNAFAGDHFGAAVAMSGDDVVVGVPLSDTTGLGGDTGSAYIFERNVGGSNQWNVLKRLVSTNAVINDHFGAAVAVSADDVVVGVPLSDTGATLDTGSAYIFNRNLGGSNQWGIIRRLVSTNAVANDQFGAAVAINADYVVVGVPLANDGGVDSGATYLYGRNQTGTNLWGQQDKFLPAAVGTQDQFGVSVSIWSNTVVVGAYNGLDTTLRTGAAYMFRTKFNNGPRVLVPLVDQTVTNGSLLSYTIPANAFADPDVNEILTLSLLTTPTPPAWLAFNAGTGLFSGTAGAAGTYLTGVVATDSDGLSATNRFSIYVNLLPVEPFFLSLGFQSGITSHIAGQGNSQIAVVTLTGTVGASFKLQRTTSLVGPVVWTDVSSGKVDSTGKLVLYDVSTANSMFYRAVPQ